MAFWSVRVTCSCPMTSENFWGRYCGPGQCNSCGRVDYTGCGIDVGPVASRTTKHTDYTQNNRETPRTSIKLGADLMRSEMEDQISCDRKLILAVSIVVSLPVPGALKAYLRPDLDRRANPVTPGESVL